MKKFLSAIFILLTINSYSQSIPEQKQVRVTDVKFEKKGKLFITGVTMQGDSVYLKFGYHAGALGKMPLPVSVGDWLTVREVKGGKRENYTRSIITRNY